MPRSQYVHCPFCAGLMEVNTETGEVLQKWAASDKKRPGEDKMSSALKKLQDDKAKRATLFDQTKQGMEKQRKEVEEKFRNQVDKVKREGVGDEPLTPFDLD